MLTRIQVEDRTQIWDYFVEKAKTSMEYGNELWVFQRAADVQKARNWHIETRRFVVNNSIVSARDFWKLIYEQAFPDFQIISKSFAIEFLKVKIEQHKNELGLAVVDPEDRLQQMNYMSSMLFDPNFDRHRFDEWISKDPERELRIKSDYLLSRLFLNFFLEKKIVCEEWIVSHLQNADLGKIKKISSLINFDLGPEYTPLQADLILRLSGPIDIKVFQVVSQFDSEFSHLLFGYQKFDHTAKWTLNSENQNRLPIVKKYSNIVGEIKGTWAEINSLLAEGVSSAEIKVVSSSLTEYSDIFFWIGKAEKINSSMGPKVSVKEISKVTLFLEEFCLLKDDIDIFELRRLVGRSGIFEENLSFSEYQKKEDVLDQLIVKAPDAILDRYGDLDSFHNLIGQKLDRSQFLRGTEKIWSKFLINESVEKLFNRFCQNTSGAVALKSGQWLRIIDSIARDAEQNTGVTDAGQGVLLESVSQGTSFKSKYVFLLGMTSDSEAVIKKSTFSFQDIIEIKDTLGYHFESEEQSVIKYHVKSLVNQTGTQLIASYPISDLSGQLKTPSTEWQKIALDQHIKGHEIHQPPPTTWDHFVAAGESLTERLEPMVSWSPQKSTYSPSSIQSFRRCPAQFYFSKILGLKGRDLEGIDVDSKDRGNWFHKIFQIIVSQDERYLLPFKGLIESEFASVPVLSELKQIAQSMKPDGLSEVAWKYIGSSYFDKVKQFIKAELDFRILFPELDTLGTEWSWELHYDFKTKSWSLGPNENTVKIRGLADRVLFNRHTKKYWIIDYKSSVKSFSHYEKWIENDEIQLLFYAEGLRARLGADADVEYVGYWQIPDLKNKRGFYPPDLRFLEFGHSKKDEILSERKEQLRLDLINYMNHFYEDIAQSKFKAEPSSTDHCKYCDWRLGCRASHL